MSNAPAIGIVTAGLRKLIKKGLGNDLGETVVTTKPLDQARNSIHGTNQINLFLYRVAYNPAWRDTELPPQSNSEERGFPTLPLNLYYLITAYSDGNDDSYPVSHELLGRVICVLHDQKLDDAMEIKAPTANSGLAVQFERIRIVPHELSIADMTQLWTSFQTPYHISVTYEISIVAVDSGQRVTVF
jgi:hypothetical protein